MIPTPEGPDDVVVAVGASPGRRVFGTATMGVLGLMLIWLALTTQPTFPWRVFLVVLGAATLWLARGLWRTKA